MLPQWRDAANDLLRAPSSPMMVTWCGLDSCSRMHNTSRWKITTHQMRSNKRNREHGKQPVRCSNYKGTAAFVRCKADEGRTIPLIRWARWLLVCSGLVFMSSVFHVSMSLAMFLSAWAAWIPTVDPNLETVLVRWFSFHWSVARRLNWVELELSTLVVDFVLECFSVTGVFRKDVCIFS